MIQIKGHVELKIRTFKSILLTFFTDCPIYKIHLGAADKTGHKLSSRFFINTKWIFILLQLAIKDNSHALAKGHPFNLVMSNVNNRSLKCLVDPLELGP